jgi:hypothetical protein
LVLTQPAPFAYPITLQTIVFQQGGTIIWTQAKKIARTSYPLC